MKASGPPDQGGPQEVIQLSLGNVSAGGAPANEQGAGRTGEQPERRRLGHLVEVTADLTGAVSGGVHVDVQLPREQIGDVRGRDGNGVREPTGGGAGVPAG